MDLLSVYEPIAKDLRSVEECLSEVFRATSDSSIAEMGDFLMSSPGKRIRPALVLLAGRSASGQNGNEVNISELVDISASVEMIHAASLIHDDMVDRADFRHNRPSVNSKWGDNVAVLFGDYVYSKAFELIASSSGIEVFHCICGTIRQMCEGELTQIMLRDRVDMSREKYLTIVKNKTASLFGACCKVGAIVCGGSVEICDALHSYGVNVGMAFQIADDYCDLAEDRDVLGKFPGRDIMLGEVTLPLINLLGELKLSDSERLRGMLDRGVSESEFVEIREMFLNSKAAPETRQTAMDYAAQAKHCLSVFDDNEYRKSLEGFSDYVTNKTFVNCVR